ncbi:MULTISPECIES: Lrp/AsnC family transcriptional regulator [Pseudomonadaceae]|jgi:Lrp/AsnC family transcriptional regulator, leucine-responsive regulatory protein|uniref:Transcriptional regulator n=1 Tax=Metapseudomonas otitidis TaxID=319939 RepID=A0A1I0SXR8_9GAMM|nr:MULTISPECIES: Lrp/AsnC family transcriptional regulator [Pseudomonas]MBO2929396.1 Lrp/AsnC family transcriptional regulator [Pseudomonas otitidis]MCO7554638.1 Lrp/AsnC family transcriptional regulator [Pseudomonas otitidis]MCP1615767.1 DNA-binding Lrp family transcriptional regulator [Pseudomonas otitidis]MDG9783611.1 Lrp/AsnC family transcriptional regulator [Pseudomonas otitidis]MDH0336174.1 Lrp/AsnC family transcriptional regulator [Pseudomonas otitidis]
MTLDSTDIRILHCLQHDGRISNQELAERVSLSPSACLRRLRNLEDSGIVRGYRPVLDAERLGVELEALVHVSMRQDEADWHERFVEQLQGWPEVVSAYIVTGASNYVLRVQARNLKQFSDFIVTRLNRAHGVTDIRSEIILQTVKEGGGALDLLRR